MAKPKIRILNEWIQQFRFRLDWILTSSRAGSPFCVVETHEVPYQHMQHECGHISQQFHLSAKENQNYLTNKCNQYNSTIIICIYFYLPCLFIYTFQHI